MFFRKKTPSDTPENVAKKSAKHVDSVVTGLILSGLIASIYGVKKLRKDQHEKEYAHGDVPVVETPEKKKGFFRRLFSRKEK